LGERGYVPVRLHATFIVIVSFAGALGAVAVAERLKGYFALGGFWAFVVLGVCFFVGFNGPMLLFPKIVPARCRKCGGKSWGRFVGGGLQYTCGACGDLRRTRLEVD
jgi:hypothetical protein